MLLKKLTNGLAILSRYATEGDIKYVANSFANGAPNHPSQCYVSVQINYPYDGSEAVPTKAEENLLKEYGWISEQDGEYWLLYD